MAEFELMRDIMDFHASANKNYEVPIKHVGARVLTFFRHSKAAISATINVIWSNFEINQDLILVHVTKITKIQSKKRAPECWQH